MALYAYPAIAEGDRAHGYSLHFPDLPGCVTAADTLAELLPSAREALALHLEGMAEDGQAPPRPSELDAVLGQAEDPVACVLVVEVQIEEAPQRVNVSLPPSVLRQVDAAAEALGMSRSGLLAESALRMIDREQRLRAPGEEWAKAAEELSASFAASPAGTLRQVELALAQIKLVTDTLNRQLAETAAAREHLADNLTGRR